MKKNCYLFFDIVNDLIRKLYQKKIMTLEDFMIPCISKTFFGIECLGCGFQRALLLIIKGKWTEAFFLYPAVYTSLLLMCGIIIFMLTKKTTLTWNGLKLLLILNCFFVFGGYIYKHF